MKRLLAILASPLLAIALMAAPAPAQATDGFASGQDLLGWCENMDMDDIHWGLCVGSITAAHDMVMTYQAIGDVHSVVCTSMSHTRGDVVGAVINYMHENPGDLDYSLGDVVLSALANKFPCQ